LIFAGVAVTAYLVDLVTKVLAVRHLTEGDPVDVVDGLLRLDLVRNPGAAFSTGTSYTLVLSVIALVAAGVVIRFGRRLGDRTWAVALGMLLAGVCGNLTDRIFRDPGVLRGHVVDFLELPHWPVFNVADMLIDAAVVLIIIQTWRGIGITGARGARGARGDRS
jgi:signal peptidase II